MILKGGLTIIGNGMGVPFISCLYENFIEKSGVEPHSVRLGRSLIEDGWIVVHEYHSLCDVAQQCA